MKRIQIESAANGYIAFENLSREMGTVASYEPHVFETFESLVKWLGQELEKPKTVAASAKQNTP